MEDNNRKRLIWSAESVDDLLAIWRYGIQRWSPEQSDEHVEAIYQTCDLIIDQPHLGKDRPELIPDVRSIPVRPHLIFYRLSNNTIEIVRVLHQHMDIDSIFDTD